MQSISLFKLKKWRWSQMFACTKPRGGGIRKSHHDATNNWVCIIAAEHTCLSLLGKNEEGSSIQALWVNWILLVLDRAQRKLYMSCSNPSRVVSYWISKAHVLKSDASKIEEGIRFFSHAPKPYSKLWCYTHKSLPTIKLTDALLKGHDRRVGLFAKILDFRNFLPTISKNCLV